MNLFQMNSNRNTYTKQNSNSRNISDAIKQNINCIDIANEYGIDLTPNGDSYRCASFIHQGNNPMSVIISEDHWFSFSDDVGGDVIDMLAYIKYNGDKSSAFKELMFRFNLGNSEYVEKFDRDESKMQRDISYWESQLRASDREYLRSRAISDDTVREFHIGYNKSEDRLIIPIFKNNKPVYWCGRDMSGNPNNSKYKKAFIGDSDYTENILYGYDTLTRGDKTLYIVEGVFDYLSMHQEGYCVLCNATGLSHKNARYIADISKAFKKTVLCFDNDASGNGFAKRLYPELFKSNIIFDVCNVPPYVMGKPIKDISDWYSAGFSLPELFKNHCHNGVEEYLKNTFDDYETLLEYVDTHSPYMSKQIKREVLRFGESFPDYDKSEFMKSLTRAKNQDEYANDFIAFYPRRICYVESIGFYEYNNQYWKQINEHVLRQSFQEMVSLPYNQETSIFNKLRTKCYTTKKPNAINCLNLRNGTLYFIGIVGNPYEFVPTHNPDDFNDYMLDYDYEPNITSPDFDEFLNSTFSFDKKLIKRMSEYFGSVFCDHTIHDKGYIFYGDGSNGKGILVSSLENMLGGEKLVSRIELCDFGERFALDGLLGKRVNICEEATANTNGAESKVKTVLSGETIRADIKGKQPISFKPNVRLFVTCNELPKSADKSGGWDRRFRGCIHKFSNKFTDEPDKIDGIHTFPINPMLREILSTDESLSAILNWALSGYRSILYNSHNFSPVDIDAEFEEELNTNRSHLYDFIRDIDWYDPILTTEQLYGQYLSWADSERLQERYIYRRTQFSRNISKLLVSELKICERTRTRDSITGKQKHGFRLTT